MSSQTQKQQTQQKEWVLLLPPPLVKSSYKILVHSHSVARPWHWQGRYGSRTHKHHNKIAIPIIDKDLVLEQAERNDDLKALVWHTPGVEFLYKEYVESNRAVREAPPFDATIHPERRPTTLTKSNHQLVPSSSQSQSQSHSFTYIELFAGIGGFAVALNALGGTCVLASELDVSCQRVYRTNFPSTECLRGNVYDIANDQLPHNNSVDLLVGGFPCQPFSALGEQPGLTCPKGHLFSEIVRILKHCQPKAFLLENVPGLLTMQDTFQVILTALQDEAGYDVTYQVLNARGLTATSRKRLFMIGFLRPKQQQSNNTDNVSPTTKEEPPSFEFPYIPDLSLRARDVLSYDNIDLTSVERDLLPVTTEQLDRLINNNASKKWRPAHLAWDNTTCSTIVSHYGHSISRGHSQLVPMPNYTHPRRFSPRECLRIMGFPLWFQWPSSNHNNNNNNNKQDNNDNNPRQQGDMARIKEQYRMIGNAVCPPLIAAIAGAVLGHLHCLFDTTGSTETHRSSSNDDDDNDDDTLKNTGFCWVDFGRQVAVELAYAATKNGRPAEEEGGQKEENISSKKEEKSQE